MLLGAAIAAAARARTMKYLIFAKGDWLSRVVGWRNWSLEEVVEDGRRLESEVAFLAL
jgi:hypothetical protein